MRFLDSLAATQTCKVAAGKYLTLAVHEQNKLFWCGTLPPPFRASDARSGFVDLPTTLRVAHVSAAYNHVAILSEAGEIYTFGNNAYGCCGHGDAERLVHTPTLVAALAGNACKQVETGQDFTVALTGAGEVFTWGSGRAGKLGLGDELDRASPAKVEGLPTACCVSAGAMHTLVVTTKGSLFSFGSGGNFCLAHGSSQAELRPRLVQTFQDKNLFIVTAAAGEQQSAAIDSSGFVYTWGGGYCGALGHGDERERVLPEKVMALQHHRAVQVVTRKRKTFVLDDCGHVFAFGWTAFGGLGCGAANRVSGYMGQSDVPDKVLVPEQLSSLRSHYVTQVSTGYYHTAVATRKGSVFVFGDNEKNQLGTDSIPGSPFPIQLDFTGQG